MWDLAVQLATSPWTIVAVILATVYIFLTWPYSYFENMGLFYLKPQVIFGNTKDRILFRKSFVQVQEDLYDKLKGHKIAGVFEGRRPIFYVMDPDLIRTVLVRDFDSFVDKIFFPIRKDTPENNALLFLKGQKWKDIRTISSPLFSSGKIKFMSNLITEVTDDLIKHIDRKNGKEFEIKEFFGKFTLDVIASCSFGFQCKSLTDKPKDDFVDAVEHFNDMPIMQRFIMFISVIIMGSVNLAKLLGVSIFNRKSQMYLGSVVTHVRKQREVSYIFVAVAKN